MSSANEVLIALSNAVPGKEDEFLEWYRGTHIPEVLALPGFLSAQSYVLAEERGQSRYQFATVYQIEGSAVEARDLLFSGVVGHSDLLDVTEGFTAPFLAPVDLEP